MSKGYHRVQFPCTSKKKKYLRRRFSVHALVFTHFGPPEDAKKYLDSLKKGRIYVVNHIDGVKTNNYYTNLELATYKENAEHAVSLGLTKVGVDACGYKSTYLNDDVVRKICTYLEYNYPSGYIIKLMNLPDTSQARSVIKSIYLGRSWKHISKDFKFTKMDKKRNKEYPEALIEDVCKMLDEKKTTKEIRIMIFEKYEFNKDVDSKRLTYLIKDIRRRKIYRSITVKYNFWK